jgi:uncharacterized protein (UPF0333 family)
MKGDKTMRWFTTVAVAVLAEAAGHFLSLGWGFLVLILAFVVVAVRTGTLLTTNSKAYATEQRLATHITAAAPAINLQANGGTIGGQLQVNTSGSSATLAVGGNTHITAAAQVDGDITGNGTLFVNGASTVEITPGTHIGGALQIDGNTTLSGNLNGGPVVVGGLNTLTGFPFGAGAVIGTLVGASNVQATTGFINAINSIATALNGSGLT